MHIYFWVLFVACLVSYFAVVENIKLPEPKLLQKGICLALLTSGMILSYWLMNFDPLIFNVSTAVMILVLLATILSSVWDNSFHKNEKE